MGTYNEHGPFTSNYPRTKERESTSKKKKKTQKKKKKKKNNTYIAVIGFNSGSRCKCTTIKFISNIHTKLMRMNITFL